MKLLENGDVMRRPKRAVVKSDAAHYRFKVLCNDQATAQAVEKRIRSFARRGSCLCVTVSIGVRAKKVVEGTVTFPRSRKLHRLMTLVSFWFGRMEGVQSSDYYSQLITAR